MTDLSNCSQKPIESSLDEVAKGAADGMKAKILLELDSMYEKYRVEMLFCVTKITHNKKIEVMCALHELKRRILELE